MKLIGVGMTLHAEDIARDTLREQFDKIMMELLFLEARYGIITDPSVSVDLAAGDLEIEVVVKAEDAAEGEEIARREIMKALEAAAESDYGLPEQYINSGNHSEFFEPA